MIFNLIHNATETVGLIGEVTKNLSLPSKNVRLYCGEGLPRDTSDLTGLVIMGGPMNVDDVEQYPFLLSEVQLIEKVLSENKPVLGICLGAQLIAKALDARVYPHRVREVGWHPIQLTPEGAQDPFFKRIPSKTTVFHWHGDTFDLPEGAVHLAKSSRCENQAFRWGDVTYGLQFHFEVTPGIVQSWCKSKESEEYIRSAGETPEGVLKNLSSKCNRMETVAKSFFTNYMKSAYSKVLAPA